MDFRRILPIFFVVFTNILGAGVILPVLPLYAEGQFGASAFQATILAAVFFAAQFVAAPILGRISDRVGRRPVLIVSQIGTVISFIFFIYAEQLGSLIDSLGLGMTMTGGLMVLFFARALDGITGGNITAAQAYITDVSTEETRARALGMLGAAFGLGFIFGPAFGGFLASISLIAPFIGAAIITSISVLLTTVMLKESLSPEKRAKLGEKQAGDQSMMSLLNNSTVLLIVLISFVFTMGLSVLQSTFSLFADRILYPGEPTETVARNVGFVLTFVGIFSVLNQVFLIGPLVKRLGERKVVIFAGVCMIIGFSSYLFVSSTLAVILFTAPISIGLGLNGPSLQSLITRFGTDRTRGQLLGLFQSGNNIALILGPIWAGIVFERISPRAPYGFVVPLAVIAIGLTLILLRHNIPSARTEPQPEPT